MNTLVSLNSIHAVVVDIEGTTTDIQFVHHVLFPYARKQIRAFIETHAQREDVARELTLVAQESGYDQTDLAGITDVLIQWIDQDKKVTPLKSLQGMIWEYGYKQGDFTGHIYEDVVSKLQEWHNAGIRLNVYSSGSVFAQKLLLGYSDEGDLTPLFTHYFDTHIGNKREQASYLNIIAKLDLVGEQILFLSDMVAELDAAQQAGMATIQLVRSESMEVGSHSQVSSFGQIHLTPSSNALLP